jgi:hypothetical protein
MSTKDKRANMRARKSASSGAPVPKLSAWQVWALEAKDKYPEEFAEYIKSSNSSRGSYIKFAVLMKETHKDEYQTYIDKYGERTPREAVSSNSAASTITESPVEEIVSRISALQEELDHIKELCVRMKGGSRKNSKTRKLRS